MMLDAVTELALLETPLSTSCTLVATTGGSRCRVGVGAALGRATTTDDTGDEEISDAGAEIEASTRSGSAGRGVSRTGGTGGACAGRGMVTIVVVCCGSPGTYVGISLFLTKSDRSLSSSWTSCILIKMSVLSATGLFATCCICSSIR